MCYACAYAGWLEPGTPDDAGRKGVVAVQIISYLSGVNVPIPAQCNGTITYMVMEALSHRVGCSPYQVLANSR